MISLALTRPLAIDAVPLGRWEVVECARQVANLGRGTKGATYYVAERLPGTLRASEQVVGLLVECHGLGRQGAQATASTDIPIVSE